jgi:hypothetical protein
MLYGLAALPVAADVQARRVQQPTAILTVISGDVLMRSAAGSYSSAMDGAVLYVGTMLRTSVDARAVITFSDGSTVELDPASDVTIEDSTARGGSTLAQSLGRTWHVVMRLTTADSRYELTTPAATASVRGGDYEVVTADGLSGLTTALSVADDPVATTVAVATSVMPVASVQTTTVHAISAPVSARSTSDTERVRKLIASTPVTRAASVAGFRDREDQSDRQEN